MNSTQLTDTRKFNVNQLVFSTPQTANIPNSKPPISYKRINISTKNEDGTIGDLVLATEQLFSFGVSENRNPETQQVNGYVMPLCLWNKDGATEGEKRWTDVFNAIVEKCKEHILDSRNEIEKFDLEASDLKRLNPLYWKKDRNGIVPGTGPTLYCKLLVSKKDGYDKIISTFYDSDTGEELDALHLMGKYCFCKAAVKIESIFIGNKISLQVKLWEADVSLLEKGMKRLLRSTPKRAPLPIITEEVPSNKYDSFDDDVGSLVDSEEEQEVIQPVSVSPERKPATRKRAPVKK